MSLELYQCEVLEVANRKLQISSKELGTWTCVTEAISESLAIIRWQIAELEGLYREHKLQCFSC